MKAQNSARRAEIEAAAFRVLERVGFKKASMLQIAKEAKASNETLYARYGNKQSLFQNLITANATLVEEALREAVSGDAGGAAALVAFGELVLGFTASDRAIIVNRAAVTDAQESGLLAQAIETHARQVILKVTQSYLADLAETDGYHFEQGVAAASDVYIGLLIGELQMQQALGAVPALSAGEISARARRACALFGRLYKTP